MFKVGDFVYVAHHSLQKIGVISNVENLKGKPVYYIKIKEEEEEMGPYEEYYLDLIPVSDILEIVILYGSYSKRT